MSAPCAMCIGKLFGDLLVKTLVGGLEVLGAIGWWKSANDQWISFSDPKRVQKGSLAPPLLDKSDPKDVYRIPESPYICLF